MAIRSASDLFVVARAWAIRIARPPDWVDRISFASLRADAFAGLTGATIVLPQAIAFAAIAGLPPEYGFYAAIVTPVIAAFFGSSWHAVSGPATAISALVFGALAGFYVPGSPAFIEAAIKLALLVGVFQLLFGLVRLGTLVDFVSHSVMIGFTAGAAMLIMLSQLRHALGIELPRPEEIAQFVIALPDALPAADWRSMLIAAVALVTGIVSKVFAPRLPNYLIALVAGTAVGIGLEAAENGVALVGVVPDVMPEPVVPVIGFADFSNLAPAAFAIALVGLLEAISVARAIATKSGQELDANREFTGQGMSNFVGSFFQCYPGSASFTRSGVNYEAGAATPLSAVFAAVFLFVILLFVAPYFAIVPIPAMAGIILLVGYKLIDWKGLRHILETSRAETAVALVTLGTTIFIDLEFAIYMGVLLSFVLFLNATARPTIFVGAPDPSTENRMFREASTFGLGECPQFVFVRIDGPLYFGSVEHVRREFRRIERERPDQKHMLFIVKGVGEIDLPGAELLIAEAKRRARRGGSFHVQARGPRTITKLTRFHVDDALPTHHVHVSKAQAISEIVPTLDMSVCAACERRVFRECPSREQALRRLQRLEEHVELAVMARRAVGMDPERRTSVARPKVVETLREHPDDLPIPSEDVEVEAERKRLRDERRSRKDEPAEPAE